MSVIWFTDSVCTILFNLLFTVPGTRGSQEAAVRQDGRLVVFRCRPVRDDVRTGTLYRSLLSFFSFFS